MEKLDQLIVQSLCGDGRMSYTDLAERVGLSVSAVHQRVRRLEQRGVIRGYTARVDADALGLSLTALGRWAFGFPMTVPAWAIALAVVMSSGVGLVFGIYPAARAAALDPVEAMRSE